MNYHRSARGVLLFVTGVLLVCLSAATRAVGFDVDPPTYSASFAPSRLSAPREWGYWAGGRISGSDVLVRYDLDGHIAAVRRYDFASQASPMALPDHGVLLQGSCTTTRLDSQGQLVWTSAGLPRRFHCSASNALDGAGNVWIHGDCTGNCATGTSRIARLDTHGVVKTTVEASAMGLIRVGSVTAATSIAAVYVTGVDDARIVRLEADGSIAWIYTDQAASSGARIERVALDPAGNLLAFGVTGSNTELLLVSLTPDGNPRFRRTLPTIDHTRIVGVAADPSGSVVLAGSATESVGGFGEIVVDFHGVVTHRFDAAGAQRWQRSDEVDSGCGACAVRFGASGDVILTTNIRGADGSLTGHLRRFAQDGALLNDISRADGIIDLQRLPDGSLLTVNARNDFAHYSAAGAVVPAPDADGAVDAFPRHVASAFDADGSTVVVSSDTQESRIVVARLDPSGALRWRREIDGQLDTRNAQVVTNARRTCWAGFRSPSRDAVPNNLIAECLDSANGTLRWSADPDEGQFVDPFRMELLDDDSVVLGFSAVASPPARARQLWIGANGTVLTNADWSGYRAVVASNVRGELLIAAVDGRLAVVDRNGALRCEFATPPNDNPFAYQLSENGRPAYLARVQALTGPVLHAVQFSASGDVSWRQQLASGGTQFAALAFASADMVVAWSTYRSDTAESNRNVTRLAGADGTRVWQWHGDDFPSDNAQLAVDAGSRTVVYGSAGYPGRTRISVLDAASGEVRRDVVEPCANAHCGIERIGADASSVVRYIESGLFTGYQGGGPAYRLHALDGAALEPVRLDQPGISGAWYPDYASGQGLFLDYIESSRTLFSAWFTHVRFSDGNDPAALRWYSLQGQVATGATTASLDLFENRGGVFAAPPATSAVHVGTATLHLDGCDRASLDYAFDSGINDGARGHYTLTRLTAPHACVAATGGSAPVSASSGGFEARHSGSWLSTATSGQGLLLSVEPGRLLFGGWFTYDPTTAADDPTAQHWFTLQGGLAGASGGSANVTILRTIGGGFDFAATNNTFAVGTATLTFQGCDRATLAYRFDDSGDAFAGHQGSIELEKIGGCTSR